MQKDHQYEDYLEADMLRLDAKFSVLLALSRSTCQNRTRTDNHGCPKSNHPLQNSEEPDVRPSNQWALESSASWGVSTLGAEKVPESESVFQLNFTVVGNPVKLVCHSLDVSMNEEGTRADMSDVGHLDAGRRDAAVGHLDAGRRDADHLDAVREDVDLRPVKPLLSEAGPASDRVGALSDAAFGQRDAVPRRGGGLFGQHAAAQDRIDDEREDLRLLPSDAVSGQRDAALEGNTDEAGIQLLHLEPDENVIQQAPLDQLIPIINPEDPRLQSDVVNLSRVLLTNDQISVLSLGLKFRVTPPKVPYLQLITGAELAAQKLACRDPIQANTLRISCSNYIKRAKIPRSNLSKEQRRALKDLNNNQAITVMSADKGGKTVILDSDVYAALCMLHLQDPAYELVSEFGKGRGKVILRDQRGNLLEEFSKTDFESLDPADRLLRMQCRRLTERLTALRDRKELSPEHRKQLAPPQPFSGNIPSFYALPKIHKTGSLTIRPIIANIEMYCEKLLLHIKPVLNIVFRSDFSVLNSYKFVESIETLELSCEARLASFDVESLFTRVPVQQTLQIVRARLDSLRETEEGAETLEELTSLSIDGFMELLSLMVEDFFFTWHGVLYKQRKGLPMGSRLSPILANIFMEEIENTVFRTLIIKPIIYLRYVDDIFIIYNQNELDLQDLLRVFNAQHPDIRLTCELERDGHLPFLDLLIQRKQRSAGADGSNEQCGPVDISIYRKPTHSHRYLHFRSSHPMDLKRNTFRGLMLRNERLLKNHPRNKNAELRYLLRTFSSARNGYPRPLLRRWVAKFQRQIRNNPRLLEFRTREQRRIDLLDVQHRQDRQVDNIINVQSADLDIAEAVEPEPKSAMCLPYVPGISDRLKIAANRYSLKSWFSFGGKLADSLSGSFKERTHVSKKTNIVYKAYCKCGERYVGESNRNLKVRLAEHNTRNSSSSLTEHLRMGKLVDRREGTRAHGLNWNRTEMMFCEKHMWRRKMMESAAIEYSAERLCNRGPSVQMSDMWFACFPYMRAVVEDLG